MNEGIIYPLTEHYCYPILNVECTCYFCNEWREKRTKFEQFKRMTAKHTRSCFCWRCCKKRDLQVVYLSALHKRDVFCELSWHASKHRDTYGPTFMKWVETELMNDKLGDGWWSTRSVYYPLYYFFHRFETLFGMEIPWTVLPNDVF